MLSPKLFLWSHWQQFVGSFFSFANYKNLPKCWSNLRQKKEKKIYCIVQRLFLMSWLRIKKATSTGRHLFGKAMFEKKPACFNTKFFQKKDELYSFFELSKKNLKREDPSRAENLLKKQDFPRVLKRTFTSLITEIYQKESRSTFCGFSQEVRSSFLQKLETIWKVQKRDFQIWHFWLISKNYITHMGRTEVLLTKKNREEEWNWKNFIGA